MEAQISTPIPDSTGGLAAGVRSTVTLYLEASKARLSSLVLLTTVVGYVLAARGRGATGVLLWTVIGTALTAFGSNILNQLWEVERDRRMHRTRHRPLPSGRLGRSTAALWGIGSSLIGLIALALGVNLLTAALALTVILLYVLVYTPMKVLTPLSTVVGAVCGAVPPMMGWTAATGRVEGGAWLLFAILFVWQIPHFLALAWLYREDYERGGFKLMPAVDADGSVGARVALVYTASLVPLCAFTTLGGLSGPVFLAGSLALTLGFLALGVPFLAERSRRSARRLFFASILYLPLLLGLMVGDMDGRLTHLVSPDRAATAVATAADLPAPPTTASALP